MKLTRKQLKELAQELGAYYCGENVYHHENITYYIDCKSWFRLDDYISDKNNVEDLKKHLYTRYDIDNKDIVITSKIIAYSCGYYGNTGQLVKYEVAKRLDRDFIKIDTFYTYYC